MFDITFSLKHTSAMVSGFDLGHIKILSDNITISSCNKVPDQSMMIFPTIVDMLDGSRVF